MLDVAMIKSTPKTADALQENGKKTVNREPKGDQEQEFQAEYEAAHEADKQTAAAPVPEENAEATPETLTKSVPVATGEDALTEEEASENAQPKFDTEHKAAISAQGIVPAAEADQVASKASLLPAAAPQAPKTSAEAETPKLPDVAAQPSAPGRGQQTDGPVKATENRAAAAKSTAETIISSKALENASEVAVAKDKGALPPEARPAAAAAVENRTIPQAVLNGPAKEPAAPRKPESGRLDKAEEISLRAVQTTAESVPKAPAPVAQVAAPQVSAFSQSGLMKLQAVKDKAEGSAGLSFDMEVVGQWETRQAGQTSGTTVPHVYGRPETPGMIARQMAEAVQKLPDKPVEISLNPRELGRVRMSISTAEAGITVHVIAERPETLDLMRRNIEQLAREFQSIGYENINFAFAEGEARNDFSDRHDGGADQEVTRLELMTEDEAPAPTTRTTATTGVDIRL